MAVELFANLASSTLGAGINNSVTTLTVASATGFPAAVTGTSQFRILVGTELMIVTNVSGTTFTVTRGAESTTAASHSSGDAVTHVVTAASLGLIGMPAGGTAGQVPAKTSSADYATAWGDPPAYPPPGIAGLLSWNSDPLLLSNSTAVTSGRVSYVRIPWPVTKTPAKVWIATGASVGTARTASQCYAGLYDSSGTQLTITADISTVTTTTFTAYGLSLVSPPSIAGGAGVYLYVAILFNFTGSLSLAAPNANTAAAWNNAGVTTTAASRALLGGTGSTALPASVTLSGLTVIAGPWAGVS